MIQPTQRLPGTGNRAAATPSVQSAAAPASLSEDRTTLSDRTQRLLASRGLDAQSRADLDALLSRAAEQHATQDPVAWLSRLNPQELALLQRAHALADPIKLSDLTTEGAANLLRYPGEGLDIDHDGLVSYGVGRIFQFPPPGAPAGVAAAWEAATSGMSELDRVSAEGMFLPIMLRVDDNGNVSPIAPGAPGAAAPWTEAGFSWSGMVQQRLESLELTFRYGKLSPEQYARDKSFLERFVSELQTRGAV